MSRHRLRAAPPLVRMYLDTSAELAELTAMQSLFQGTATTGQVDTLLKTLHLLQFAGSAEAEPVTAMANIAMGSIIERGKTTGRFGVTGEERKTVAMLVDFSTDYWRRQSGIKRDKCVLAVNTWYQDINNARSNKC